MRRGFSFIEVMVSVAVLAVLSVGVYQLMHAGAKTYNLESGYVQMQQDMRRAMDTMTRELREASRGNFSDTDAFPHNITFRTLNVTGIQYFCDYDTDQLKRQLPGNTATVIGNDINEVTFTKTGDLLTVNLTVEKPVNVITGARNITASLEEKVRLRND